MANRHKQTIEIDADVKKLQQKLDQAERKLDKTGQTGFSAFKLKMVAGITAATAALGKLVSTIGDWVQNASDLAESTSKFNVVFRNVGKEAKVVKKELTEAYGLSRLEATKLLSATGDLLTGFGLQGDVALDLSQKVNTLAVDLASFSNAQGGAEAVASALNRALLGERESLKTYGIAIKESDVQTRLLEKGQKDLTGTALNQAKAIATLELAYKQSKNAIGDFVRTSDQLANQQRQLKSDWEDLSSTLGKLFIPAVTDAVGGIRGMVEGFDDLISLKPTEEIEKEKDEINNLIQSIVSLNKDNETRNKLLKSLQSKYPDILENMDTEKVTNEQLKLIYKDINDELERKIYLQSQDDRIVELERQKANYLNEQTDALEGVNKWIEYIYGSDSEEVLLNITDKIKLLEELDKDFKAGKGHLPKYLEKGTDFSKRAAIGLKEVTGYLNLYKRRSEEILEIEIRKDARIEAREKAERASNETRLNYLEEQKQAQQDLIDKQQKFVDNLQKEVDIYNLLSKIADSDAFTDLKKHLKSETDILKYYQKEKSNIQNEIERLDKLLYGPKKYGGEDNAPKTDELEEYKKKAKKILDELKTDFGKNVNDINALTTEQSEVTVESIKNTVEGAADSVAGFFGMTGDQIKETLGPLYDEELNKIAEKAMDIMNSLRNDARGTGRILEQGLVDQWTKKGPDAMETFSAGFSRMIKRMVAELVSNSVLLYFLSLINPAGAASMASNLGLNVGLGKVLGLKGFATGGENIPRGVYKVHQDETVALPQGSNVLTARQTKDALRGSSANMDETNMLLKQLISVMTNREFKIKGSDLIEVTKKANRNYL